MSATKSKRKAIVDQIMSLSEDNAMLAEVQKLLNGGTVPHVKGAEKPVSQPIKTPRMVKGRINPQAFVEERDELIRFNTAWFNYYGEYWSQYEKQMKLLMTTAEQFGLNLNDYAPETLSAADIKSKDDIFEATDEQLDDFARRIEMSTEMAYKLLSDAKKKRWASILRRVQRLREDCRNPIPPRIAKQSPAMEVLEAWKHTHALRYALYTNRSNLLSSHGEEQLILLPRHLVMACMVISIARENREKFDIRGVLVQLAPRHGKTDLMVADCALDINLRPSRVHLFIHHVIDFAKDRSNKVRRHFDTDFPEGRRRKTLFPDLSMEKHLKKGGNKLFVQRNGRRQCMHEESNLLARGVNAKGQGLTAHDLHLDDPTDEKEQHEAGTRERTNQAMSMTWLPRLTGPTSFFVYICTSWHPSDFASILLKLSREGKLNMAYYAESCGGPENDFKPIWPEAGYNENFLRGQFSRLGASSYACIYQNNPDSEASKRISHLEFYPRSVWDDYKSGQLHDPKWKRFFEDPSTKYYLVLDPSGTDNKRSNLAGMMYWAFGTLRESNEKGVQVDIPKALALEYWSIPASQHKLSTVAAEWRDHHRLDYVIVETTSGYHATADNLIENHGFASDRVIKRTPGQGSKPAKLMKFAIFIERGDVLFPGTPTADEHGRDALHLDSDWSDVGNQLLRAGSEKEDNLLDCVQVFLKEIAHDVFALRGETVVVKPLEKIDPRITRKRDFYTNLLKRGKTSTNKKPQIGRFAHRSFVCQN